MTNNTNNTNNSNGTGNAGRGVDPGSEWVFPDRADLPLVNDPGMDASSEFFPTDDYNDRYWSPIWFAWRVLPDYTKLAWDGLDPGDLRPMDDTGRRAELQTLVDYARFERADAMDEIMAQKDEFVSEFMGLLAITPTSNPNTYRLMHLANLFAAFTVMYFKGVYKRRRPSQLLPMLRPPIQVPGHASYPSGHSTQSHLIARCTALVLPSAMVTDPHPIQTSLDGLAARIARNREIAGLHFHSDTCAGEVLAGKIFDLIEADRATSSGDPVVPGYKSAIEAAKAEWP